MRRALSLIALAATLFTASADPTLLLGTITAVDTDATNKDSWSVKGATIEGVDFDTLEDIVEKGISAVLLNKAGDTVDTVAFDEEDCKFLSKERGVVCKIQGARLSVRLFTSTTRTKGADPVTTSFWKVAGSARGRNFVKDITDDGLTLNVVSLTTLAADAFDCTEKILAHGQQRLTCVPVEEE